MRRIIWLFAIMLALAPGSNAVATRAPATPTGVECSIKPLAPDALEEIVAAGFRRAPNLQPAGEAPSATALLSIFDVVSDSIACTNANQPLRALALFSNRYLAQRFAGQDGADELGHLLAAATRSPGPALPEDRLVLIAVSDLVLYTDGRIGAQVTTANVDESFTDRIVFVETRAGWRIDQVVLDDQGPATGTPSASSQDS